MQTVNTIMVAVDFSDDSINAAAYAANLAVDVDATILLVNIFNKRDVDMMEKVALRVPEFSVKKHLDENLKERSERLDDLAKKISNENLKIAVTVRVGIPYKALLEEMQEKKPDLLVMGAKGRSNIVDIIIGSCAQKMFRRSSIPLLSIREDQIQD